MILFSICLLANFAWVPGIMKHGLSSSRFQRCGYLQKQLMLAQHSYNNKRPCHHVTHDWATTQANWKGTCFKNYSGEKAKQNLYELFAVIVQLQRLQILVADGCCSRESMLRSMNLKNSRSSMWSCLIYLWSSWWTPAMCGRTCPLREPRSGNFSSVILSCSVRPYESLRPMNMNPFSRHFVCHTATAFCRFILLHYLLLHAVVVDMSSLKQYHRKCSPMVFLWFFFPSVIVMVAFRLLGLASAKCLAPEISMQICCYQYNAL